MLAHRKLTFYEQLTTVKMNKTENVTDYLIRAKNYWAYLKSAGKNISDNLVIDHEWTIDIISAFCGSP